MTDHKVVAMPKNGNLERRYSVAEFARSQDTRQPPRSPGTRRTKATLNNSRSPGRRRLPNSRDIVQEVYDRMGVNYVRGQNSAELRDGSGSVSKTSRTSNISRNSPSIVPKMPEFPADVVVKSSNSFRKTSQSLTVDTKNETEVEGRQERNSVRSTRSVKSLLDAFGGGKSVSSSKSVASRNNFQELESPPFRKNSIKSTIQYVNTTPSEEVKEKIIDCRNDNDVDSNMSIISLDESQWTRKKQTQPPSKANVYSSKVTDSSSMAFEEKMNKMIQDKLDAKISELNSVYEEKFRRLEENTKSRLDELEKKFKKTFRS